MLRTIISEAVKDKAKVKATKSNKKQTKERKDKPVKTLLFFVSNQPGKVSVRQEIKAKKQEHEGKI